MKRRRRAAGEPQRWALGAPVIAFADAPGLNAGDAMVAAALGDGTVRLLMLAGEGDAVLVQAHRGAVRAIVHHAPTGDWLTGGDDGRVCRIARDGACTEVASLGSKWVEHLIVDPASGMVVAASGRTLHGVAPDLARVKPLATLPSTAGGLALDATRGRLAVARYGGVSLRRFEGDDTPWIETVWKGSHLAVAVSPDGQWLVSATQENALHVWPMDGGEDCGMRGYPGKPVSLGWSADSQMLLTSGLDSMVVWRFDGDGPQGREPLLLGWGGGGLGTVVAAHPRAPAGAAGFGNGAVLFGDLETRRAVMLKEPDGAEVTAMAWVDGGVALVVGQADGSVTTFDVRS